VAGDILGVAALAPNPTQKSLMNMEVPCRLALTVLYPGLCATTAGNEAVFSPEGAKLKFSVIL